MPNRIIREGWLESERIDALDAFAERFFLRLCLRADDFGRFSANPQLLKSSLFPLKDEVRSTDIARWTSSCEDSGLLCCYEFEEKRFLQIVKFDQRTRAQSSKYPAPDGIMPERSPPDVRRVSDTCPSCVSHPRTEAEAEPEPVLGDESPRPPLAPGGAGFAEFWEAYPRKVGKVDAEKAWKRAKKRPPLDTILAALKVQRENEAWRKDGGQFIPYPATWINRGQWADELTTSASPKPKTKFFTAPQPLTLEQQEAKVAAFRAAKAAALTPNPT